MLHDAQVLHLKLWPRILFQRSITSQLRVDASKHHLAFDLELHGALPTTGVLEPDAGKLLNEWVKSILGPEWSVSIYLSSDPKKKPAKLHFPGEEKKDDKPAT